jgi:DNA-binding SARP family transcriptional activator
MAGADFADAVAARLTELRSSVLADRIEADLATGEGASLVGELRVLLSADPLAERPRALLMRAVRGRPPGGGARELPRRPRVAREIP